jgi:hypothetical protein
MLDHTVALLAAVDKKNRQEHSGLGSTITPLTSHTTKPEPASLRTEAWLPGWQTRQYRSHNLHRLNYEKPETCLKPIITIT